MICHLDSYSLKFLFLHDGYQKNFAFTAGIICLQTEGEIICRIVKFFLLEFTVCTWNEINVFFKFSCFPVDHDSEI